MFALLPAGVGALWHLAHGLPVGLQNAPDLSAVPLVGQALKDMKLSASLLGDWPFSGTWRLLLLAPVVGLVLGGRRRARRSALPPLALWGLDSDPLHHDRAAHGHPGEPER